MPGELHELSASDIARAIAAGRADPRDVARHFLDRSGRLPAARHVYARLTEERALAEADAAADRARSGARRSFLDGVPVSWKDNFDTAGVATEGGSRLLEGRTPARDAEVLARAAAGGLVCLGKTNMVELAFSGLGLNPIAGTPINPFDPATPRLPGGSSSGAAVSVAAGLAPAAFGTDTGGSVRIPAAWNGLVGLKTTEGRLPLEGIIPLSPAYDTVGPLARTVEDAARLFEVIAGEPSIDLGAAGPGDLELCIARFALLSSLEPAVAAAIAHAHERLARAGVRLKEAPLSSLDSLEALGPVPVAAEAYALWGEAIEARPGAVFERIAERVLAGRSLTAAALLKYRFALRDVRGAYLAESAAFDGVLVPTVAVRALTIAEVEASPEGYRSANPRALGLTSIANRLGLCAITIPVGLAGEPPLPVGLSILAHPNSERRLLQIAAAIERALAA